MATALFHPRPSKRKSIIARSFLLGLLFFSNIHIQCVAAKASVAMNDGRNSIDVGDPISVDFAGSSTTSKKVWKIAIVQKGKSIRSQKNICNDCWKRVCGSKTCREKFASGTVTFSAEEIGGVGEYDAYLTTNSYIGRAGPVSFTVTSSPTAPINPSTSTPTIPDPSPAPSASPVASSNKACNPNLAKHCIEATLEDNGGSVRVSFANNRLQRGKIIFVRAGEQFINEDNVIVCEGIKMEKIVTKKSGAKNFDIQKCDLNAFDVYQTTNAYSTRIGPIRMKVTHPTEAPSPSPTESTEAPSPPPSKSTENPSPSPSQSPEAPSSSPTPDSVCNKSYSDEESLNALQGFTEGSEFLSKFLTDFANGVEVVSDKNDRRLVSIQGGNLLAKGLDFFSNKGPLGWVSFAFSIGTWFTGKDDTTQEILDKVNEISSKIDALGEQLEDGIEHLERIIRNLEDSFRLENIHEFLKERRNILNSLQTSYKNYVKEPNFDEYKKDFIHSCNERSGDTPVHVFRELYLTSCKECAIQAKRGNDTLFDNPSTGEMEKIADILNKRYSIQDDSDFRQGFGILVLTGMIDAFFLKIQCLPQVEDTCFAESIVWLNTVDAMSDGILEVASHLSERASQLDYLRPFIGTYKTETDYGYNFSPLVVHNDGQISIRGGLLKKFKIIELDWGFKIEIPTQEGWIPTGSTEPRTFFDTKLHFQNQHPDSFWGAIRPRAQDGFVQYKGRKQ